MVVYTTLYKKKEGYGMSNENYFFENKKDEKIENKLNKKLNNSKKNKKGIVKVIAILLSGIMVLSAGVI